MRIDRKIIAVICCIASLVSLCVVPAQAAETTYTTNNTFWQWLDDAPFGALTHHVLGYIVSDEVCPKSSDSKHHAASTTGVSSDGYYTCVCENCGQEFTSSNKAQEAYTDYTSTLPYQQISEKGGFVWSPTISDISSSGLAFYVGFNSVKPSKSAGFEYSDTKCSFSWTSGNTATFDYPYATSSSGSPSFGHAEFSLVVPISGVYTLRSSLSGSGNVLFDDGSLGQYSSYYTGKTASYSVNSSIAIPSNIQRFTSASRKSASASATFYLPIFDVVPLENLINTASTNSSDTYNVYTRAASLSGDYGIIGDNGQITKVDSTSIVNETDNSVYNPVTNTTSTVKDWTYDYSTRSYGLTLDTGDTMTVTYGDENITIQEGDTVYNVYYLIEDSGSGGGGEDPTPVHTHNYTSAITTEPTCTDPGIRTYVCTDCADTYREAVAALGHDWQVERTVQTVYDEDGSLLVEGFTIYQCSRCGEQYKADNFSGPPGSGTSSGGGTSAGGGAGTGEEKESIFTKIGKLFGTIGEGALKIVEAILGKLLDGLISLAEMINEKLTALVEMVLSWFDTIPGLFSGFLSFLSAVFPFLPSEVMLLLTFGLAAVVFIGIIKAIRR